MAKPSEYEGGAGNPDPDRPNWTQEGRATPPPSGADTKPKSNKPKKQPVSPPKASQKKGSDPWKGQKKKKPPKKAPRDLDPGKDKLSPKQLEREYGFAYAFFRSDPELWGLLQKAIKNNWSRQRFRAALQDTKWFKTNSDVYRQNYALKYSDPATYKERFQNYRDLVKTLAGEWGADLTQKELNTYAERAFMFGWSESQILDKIAVEVKPTKGMGYTGQLASVEQQLRQVAMNNGVRIPPAQLNKWMRQIVRGNADVAQFENHIRKIAAKTFGAFSEEIRGGMDAVDIAAPYIQSMAEILELNPADVNMYDRTIRRALSFTDENGNPAPMSISDFEDSLRYDRRWQYTDNARETFAGYAIELGKMWGVI